MRNGFFTAIGAIGLGGAAAFGQAPSPQVQLPPAPVVTAGVPSEAGAGLCPAPASESDPWAGRARGTFSADYLLWWVRKGPTPGPLLTTGSADDAIPGALGQPNTVPLFGDGGLNY